jgi:hypothetical protein
MRTSRKVALTPAMLTWGSTLGTRTRPAATSVNARAASLACRFPGGASLLKAAPAAHTRTRTLATRAGAAPPAPDNVAAAPADAEVTASGLASIQLKAGTNAKKPGPRDKVRNRTPGHFNSQARWVSIGSVGMRLERVAELSPYLASGRTGSCEVYSRTPRRTRGDGPRRSLQGFASLRVGACTHGTCITSSAYCGGRNQLCSSCRIPQLVPHTHSTSRVQPHQVTVHYSGWTTDGKLFDSSVQRGETISFPLNGVIKGWTEGLQLMTEGEARRFWIPADLAYGKGGGGAPGGTLVFDVELFKVN